MIQSKNYKPNEILKLKETNETYIFGIENFGNKTFELYEISGKNQAINLNQIK